ncbi:MAG: nuclease-related domain-containing protein, partial [Tepidisphaeraceae bacterium]
QLQRRGWIVEHDIVKSSGGNVDHVVAGLQGIFTIEVKLTRSGKSEIAQARSHAVWAANALGAPVVPVLCVANRALKPRLSSGVWIVGAAGLARFLRRHRAGSVDVAEAQRQLLRLRGRRPDGRLR